MEENLQGIIIDALTDAIEKKTTATIKSSLNNFLIVITGGDDGIIISVSKTPQLSDDIIPIVSHALGKGPDMIYSRPNSISEDIIVNYMVWLNDDEHGRQFIEKEYRMPQNNITYLSRRAINHIQSM